MRIYADRRDLGKIRKQTEDYVNRYNSQKALYDEYATKVANDIRELFENEIAPLGDVRIKFQKRNDSDIYAINICHSSSRYRSNLRRYYDVLENFPKNGKVSRNFSGISWDLLIYTDLEFAAFPSNNYIHKIPQLRVEHTDYDDLPELKATYNFFEKADSIDWVEFFTKVYEECPKLGEFKTNLSDGSLNVDLMKSNEAVTYLDSIVGKDVWVLVKDYNGNIKNTYNKRGHSLWYARNFWVKIINSSNSFYSVSAFPDNGFSIKYAENMLIKKTSLHLVDPIEVKTSDDFNEEQ